jgi:tetratricopeptide (TPR) repeat protein
VRPPLIAQIAIFALLFIGLAGTVQAATIAIDPERQEHFADHLFQNGQYRRAGEVYQRLAFFFSDLPNGRALRYKAGKAFLMAKDPAMALTFFQPLIAEAKLDTFGIEAFFLAAQCHLQMNAYSHAMVQLNNLVALSDDPSIDDRAYYRMAWIHIDRTDWASALRYLDRMTPAGIQRHNAGTIKTVLNEKSADIPSKNPTTAGLLSIIPGGGQLYCHRYKDALIAFIINAATFWAAVEAFDSDQEALGGLLSVAGLGFFTGNIYGAVNDARKFNALQKSRFADHLRQLSSGHFPRGAHDHRRMIIGMSFSF